MRYTVLACLVSCVFVSWGCQQHRRPTPGTRVQRIGDEIVVCGQLFHTGAPVVTWLDFGGYDAYRVETTPAPTTTPTTTASTTTTTSAPATTQSSARGGRGRG